MSDIWANIISERQRDAAIAGILQGDPVTHEEAALTTTAKQVTLVDGYSSTGYVRVKITNYHASNRVGYRIVGSGSLPGTMSAILGSGNCSGRSRKKSSSTCISL
jgi:hypothetical protein